MPLFGPTANLLAVLRGVVAFLLLVAAAEYAAAQDPVTVTLASGRIFTGLVDAETDDEQLVMRFEHDGVAIWRPIDWTRIVAAEYRGHKVPLNDFPKLAESLRSERLPDPEAFTAPATAAADEGDLVNEIDSPPISLHMEAGVGRWTAGVETDGIVVRVVPLDEFGHGVAVNATLHVTLIGTQPSSFRSEFAYRRGAPFPQLAQWTVQLSPADFQGGEARVRLPFQAWHPQFDLDLGPMAVVNADLVVPGAGVFSASDDFVRIRLYSPTRDWLQQLEGYRFFPGERLLRTQ